MPYGFADSFLVSKPVRHGEDAESRIRLQQASDAYLRHSLNSMLSYGTCLADRRESKPMVLGDGNFFKMIATVV